MTKMRILMKSIKKGLAKGRKILSKFVFLLYTQLRIMYIM